MMIDLLKKLVPVQVFAMSSKSNIPPPSSQQQPALTVNDESNVHYMYTCVQGTYTCTRMTTKADPKRVDFL